MLSCATRPIIESSSKLRFGCNDVNYAGLPDQYGDQMLNRYQNHWSHIFDFTPVRDGSINPKGPKP